ncbi:type III secretion system export apparatus subunit SctS [Anaerobiospirillum sp. NML120449]|uniref:type III secretion system export apparatus subunit SctS n=1 Tax=Anaerobiospirillum sp. NML120449 TaxID=2932817 RepID=UPI00248B41C9|nr:type III secretion system export apparatus subunit SctS [Anaerobiospirillum sp. NML120449]
MTSTVQELVSQGFFLVLILSMPPILIASIVGILFALLQAITQLQEQTLSFAVKLVAVAVVLFMLLGWIGAEILKYGTTIFDYIQAI